MLTLSKVLASQFDPAKIKKIYLIPSKDVNFKKIKNIHEKFKYDSQDTLIVRFNRCDKTNKKLFQNHTDIRFIRGHLLGRNLHRNFKLFGSSSPHEAVHLAYNDQIAFLEKIKSVNDLKYMYSFNQVGIVPEYKSLMSKLNINATNNNLSVTTFHNGRKRVPKVPSIGFIAVVSLLDIYPNATFYLMDFTFEAWGGHDMVLEKKICCDLLKGRVVVV